MLIICLFSACAYGQGKATGYTTWDDNYFYVAFRVDDPNITGTNSKIGSDPWKDDSIEIFLETDNKHQSGRSKNSYSMCVSVANGAVVTAGGNDGKRQKKPVYTFKYATYVEGSLNSTDDLDSGYMIELALPWQEMGVTAPKSGETMSFNAIIRMRGDADKFISLSPSVLTEEDIDDASKWTTMVFSAASFGAATLSNDKIVSARYIARLPLIDGQVRPNEWHKNTSFTMQLPIELPKGPRYQLQKMVLAQYFYWYQADARKVAPFSHVRDIKGQSLLIDQPVRGAGPWFSYDRVQWHKNELADMKRAGIDIALPVYQGDINSRTEFADKGLDCMVEAMRELDSEGRSHPLIGMLFDTTSLTAAYGNKVDLHDEEVKRTFYGMIRDFFSHIPEEYRAQVQMGDDRGDKPCYIVDLQTGEPFGEVDPAIISYVNEQFANDFGAGLVWLGGKDVKDKIPGLDGYCSNSASVGFDYSDAGKIKISTVSPGYDCSIISSSAASIRTRDGGDTYKTAWDSALEKHPNWIMIDSWNGLHEGSEICETRQYGTTYLDNTALQTLKFKGPKQYDAKYMRHNTPKIILPGNLYYVDLLIQNDGPEAWKAADGYALAYRWYQDGRVVGETAVKRPIQFDIQPGHSANLAIGVTAVKKDGESLPEGDYELRFEMIRLTEEKWFSSLGDEGFSVPVKIGKPEDVQARFLAVDGPVMIKTATPYTYKVKVRNDGTTDWKAGTFSIGCRLFKITNYIHGGIQNSREEITTVPMKVSIAKDVVPGNTADVTITVDLKDADRKPVPVSKQSEQWSYQLRFDLWDGSKWLSDSGIRPCDRIVDVFDADYGASLVDASVPETMNAGTTTEVKIVVKNNGVETWNPKTHGFGYHWYNLDGSEAVWEGQTTPLKIAVKPGEPAVVTTMVTAPSFDGRYILAFDLIDRDRWASTSEISRGGDLLSGEVTVTNGKLAFVDLTSIADVSITSPDNNRQAGNIDGKGLSFPAEMMLPESGVRKPNSVYPSGYLCSIGERDAVKSGRISFNYLSKGDKSAVACTGQVVSIPEGRYARLHIVACSALGDQESEFGLQYASAIQPAKLTVSSWSGESAKSDQVAFAALHRHSPSGDELKKCYLFSYTIPVDTTQSLKAIVLPKNDKIRVVAITLEKP